MNNEARANVNIRIYQLNRKLEQLQYDAQVCENREQAKEILQQAREIELLIGYWSVPVTYTVSFRTVEGYPASVQILAKSSAHAQNSAKELFPEIHRVTGALLTPLWN